jgi:hypothetical protein
MDRSNPLAPTTLTMIDYSHEKLSNVIFLRHYTAVFPPWFELYPEVLTMKFQRLTLKNDSIPVTGRKKKFKLQIHELNGNKFFNYFCLYSLDFYF